MPTDLAVYPDVETGQDVDWSSSDTSVATIDADGKITGLTDGEVVITATVKGKPSVTASCGVQVDEAAPPVTDAAAADATTTGDDTESILIWEDAPPEAAPAGWDEQTTSTPSVAPNAVRPGTVQPEFIPATSAEGYNIENLAASSGNPNAPIRLPASKGSKVVKPKRDEVDGLLKSGFVWRIYFASHITTTGFDTENSDTYGMSLFLVGNAIKTGGNDVTGNFEPTTSTKFYMYLDTSDPVKNRLAKGGPDKWVYNYEGKIDDFNFTLSYDALDVLAGEDITVYNGSGKFHWTFICTDIRSFADGSVNNFSGDGDVYLGYNIWVNTQNYNVSLYIGRPFMWLIGVNGEKTVKFTGYFVKDPILDPM